MTNQRQWDDVPESVRSPIAAMSGGGRAAGGGAGGHRPPITPISTASLGAMASAHVCASVPNFMVLEWQIYFHREPMFKEIVSFDGEMVEKREK